jgi:hypothetical protein
MSALVSPSDPGPPWPSTPKKVRFAPLVHIGHACAEPPPPDIQAKVRAYPALPGTAAALLLVLCLVVFFLLIVHVARFLLLLETDALMALPAGAPGRLH